MILAFFSSARMTLLECRESLAPFDLEEFTQAWTFSYHVQINVSVKRGILSAINIHCIHKGKVYYVLYSTMCTFKIGIKKLERQCICTRGRN